ncbi:MAG: hypothetical protein JO340_14650 [Acidobacteriaceae bacterium]|nr:hypothetical protein [Acidobacteriaceae bacterium]
MKARTKLLGLPLRFALGLSAPALALVCFSATASAQSYDLFQTSSGAYVDLSSMGLGSVNLQGIPIQGSTGNTDTMMQRGTLNNNVYPVVCYALFMESTSPVTYNGQLVDVYITVNNTAGSANPIPESVLPQPDSITQPTGNTVTLTSSSTFNSNISVNADVILVTHGGSVTNSANIVGHQGAPSINLSTTNSTYSSTAPSGYPNSSAYPSGGFYPIPKHTGPHPVIPSSCGNSAQTRTQSPAANMIAKPACISYVQAY